MIVGDRFSLNRNAETPPRLRFRPTNSRNGKGVGAFYVDIVQGLPRRASSQLCEEGTNTGPLQNVPSFRLTPTLGWYTLT